MSRRIPGLQHLRKTRNKKLKILIVRPDKIGDVVLSTPVLEALKHSYPESEIHFLVRDLTVPIVRHNAHITRVITYRPTSVHKGITGFFRLWRAILREKYDVALVLQVQAKPSLAIFFSRIPFRIGPFSKWYSFLIFNKGKRQKRSTVGMHETDYNLMLLRKLGIRVATRSFEPHITPDADSKDRMRIFVRNSFKWSNIEDIQPFVIVHPGMGGSALNWPEGYYIDLIKRLITQKIPVMITGSQNEKILVERVMQEALHGVTQLHNCSIFVGENSDQGLSDFIGLLSLSKVVVAPSTGPLHIAVALGKRTVSFYPPIKVQSAIRWGPYSAFEDNHKVLVPDALCGQDYKCAGSKCFFYFCMERMSVEEAYQKIKEQLESKEI